MVSLLVVRIVFSLIIILKNVQANLLNGVVVGWDVQVPCRHHHQDQDELEEILLPKTAEPAGQTPCTQRKKASFRFRL